MHLVDTYGCLARVDALAFLNPGRVIPVEVITERGDGGGSRPVLRVLGKGVCLENHLASLGGNGKFVEFAWLDVRDETFVNAGSLKHLHGAGIRIPVIKVTNYTDGCGMGSPYSEIIAGFAIERFWVGTKFIVNLIMGAFSEQVTVPGGDKAGLGLLFLISDCHKVNPP